VVKHGKDFPLKKKAPKKTNHPATHAAFLRGKDAKLSAVARSLGKAVKKAVPKVKEGINAWRQPTFESNGPFCVYMVSKNHITFLFIRGASLPDPEGLLEGTGKNLRHVKIRSEEDLSRKGFKELLKAAARLNAKEPQVGMRPYRK
jgi:hypothetical protein